MLLSTIASLVLYTNLSSRFFLLHQTINLVGIGTTTILVVVRHGLVIVSIIVIVGFGTENRTLIFRWIRSIHRI